MSATKEHYHDLIESGNRFFVNDIRDYPILFDTQMVQSIVSGLKTRTNRLFRSPLIKQVDPASEIFFENGQWIANLKNGKKLDCLVSCPFGKVGDFLWVKETWAPAIDEFVYKADCSPDVLAEERNKGLWHPSIHMPKTAARLWLQITDIKACRIQSVSEYDARQEGCGVGKILNFDPIGQVNFREGFIYKWISIYGIQKYYENPWTWSIAFAPVALKPSVN